MVRLWHKHESSGRVYDYKFGPYFIEPYAVGRTSHVIGWREPPGAIRTFKIERIQRIETCAPPRPYTIPEHFDPRGYLADPWSIWYTEARPVQVVLKFTRNQAFGDILPHEKPGFSREIPWRRTERLEEQPDGSLIWRAPVADPQEIVRWIRGWGTDVEVLAPPELRDWMMGEARRLAETYGWQVSPVGHG